MALIAAMPLPFGSARPWAWSLAAVSVACLLLGHAAWLAFSPWARLRMPARRFAVPVLLASLALLWAAAQTLPLDGALADPVWARAGDALGLRLAGRVTSDVFATATAAMRLLAYFGIFALVAEIGRSPRRAEQALLVFVVATAAYALYGMLQFFLAPDRLLWFERWAYAGDLTSTFVNRNSCATFMGLGLLCSVTLLARQIEEATAYSVTARGLAADLLHMATGKAWLPIIGAIACLGAALLTHSRGGLLSLGVGLMVLLAALLARRGQRRRGRWIAVGLAVASALLIVNLGGEITLERFGERELTGEKRPDVFRLTYAGIVERPLTGHGLGTFENAFRAYGDGSLEMNWDRAHNDYLEAAFELGLPAALLLLASIAYVALQCALGIRRRRRDAHYPALATAATALVGAHSLVDFSLQMPAIAALYAALLGLGYGQSWSVRPGARVPRTVQGRDSSRFSSAASGSPLRTRRRTS